MKKQIALITGGHSGEAVVSYKTAKTIYNHLDKEKYDVYVIDIRKEGWYHTTENGEALEIDKNDFSITVGGNKINFDAAFIALHGTPGEDGKLQGYLDMTGIPYTTCNAVTSAITFNKRYTVAVAKMAGVAVAESVHIFTHSPAITHQAAAELKLPVFVKPANGGSSIGMSKVSQPENLTSAIEKAFKEDDQVLVEQMINGREFTVGVYKENDEIIILALTEVKAADDKDFFDYEAKYEGKSTETTPAVVDESTEKKVREAAAKIYEVFNCRGVIRIDFIFDEETQTPYMLEINTVPGQSDASIIPQQVRASGRDLNEFYGTLLEECLNRK